MIPENYNKFLVATMLSFGALIAQGLSGIFPITWCSVIGMVVGTLYGSAASDEIQKRFKTDIDHILKPNEAMLKMILNSVFIGILSAAVVGYLINAPFGAVTGILVTLVFASQAMK